MKLMCSHPSWKKDDQIWRCFSCFQQQIEPYCYCGSLTSYKILDGFAYFTCKQGQCGYNNWYRCIEDFEERIS